MNPFDILRESAYFFVHNLLRIATLCLPWLLLEALAGQFLQGALDTELQPGHSILLALLFYPLYSALLILLLDARSANRSVSKRELLARALRLWPTLAVLTALSTLVIMLGFSLLILPGLWVMLRLIFAEYLLVLDGLEPLAALKESFRLSDGYFWVIAGCLLSIMLPLWLLELWSLQQLGEQPDMLFTVMLEAGNGLLQLFAGVVSFRLFMLRRMQPDSVV
jgi:hypothetical protein